MNVLDDYFPSEVQESMAENWMGILLILVGIVCCFFCSFALFHLLKLRPLHTFHHISAAILTCGILSCFVYIVCGSLIMFSALPYSKSSHFIQAVARTVGGMQVYAESVILLLHSLTSINRFVAIIFPMRYQHMFSMKKTDNCIILSCLLPLPLFLFFSTGLGACVNAFDSTQLFWLRPKGVCQIILSSVECTLSYVLTTITLGVDTFCMLKLKFSTRYVPTKNAKKERKFVLQSFLIGILFWVCTLSYYLVGFHFSTVPWKMFCSSSIKSLSSVLVGLIICSLNRRLFLSRSKIFALNTVTAVENNRNNHRRRTILAASHRNRGHTTSGLTTEPANQLN